MSTKLPAARILIVNSSQSQASEITQLIDEDQQRLRMTAVDAAQFPTELRANPPSVILLNAASIGDAEAETLRTARTEAPQTPIIVASDELDPAQIRRLFASGVNDWLCKPVKRADFVEAVRSVASSLRAAQNTVHAVISTVGGAGATSVAVAMADLTATRHKDDTQSVALFDLDFSTGNCGYLLGNANEYNLTSVLNNPSRIDSEFLSVIRKDHVNGFAVYSFKRTELLTNPNGFELVLRLLDAVSQEHDITILDIPYYETPWKDDVLSAVNSCTLVTALNLPAIRHTLDMVDRLIALRGAQFDVVIAFNKWQKSLFGQRISERKLSELFGDRRRVTFALDEALHGEAIDRGVPPSEVRSSASFLKQINHYLKSLKL